MPSSSPELTSTRQPSPTLLCMPFLSGSDLADAIAVDLAELSDFDPELNQVGPETTARSAEAAIRIRLETLLRVYAGEYTTDSYDVERLARQIREGEESIWFWGAADQITRLHRLLEHAEPEQPPVDLGTVSVLRAEEEFGPGHGELCRSGSMDRTLGAKAPIIWRTLNYHRGTEKYPHRRYHTLILAARTRISTAEVRGGEAVHRIHSRYVRSRYWGYLPFYLMQGGVLEMLELRESNRDPEDVRRALQSSPAWHFADPADAAFASAMAAMNFGLRPPTAVAVPSGPVSEPEYRLVMPADPELTARNHAVALPLRDGPGLKLEQAVDAARAAGVCATAVHVALTDPRSPSTQVRLASEGFRLTAVVPPKHSWFESGGARREVRTDAIGIWTRPRSDVCIAPPYYHDVSPSSPEQEQILGHLGSLLAAWR